MDMIYDWIRSLVSYLILMTMIMNLLPDKKYEKYLHLFTGMVFLLLVFRPFTDMTGLEEWIVGSFERITFQTDARMLREEIEDADGARMGQLAEQYRAVIAREIAVMSEAVQAEYEGAEIGMEMDPEHAEFGSLNRMDLKFRLDAVSPKERVMAVNRQISELKARIGERYGMEERDITVILETE